jgi:hypothetical protein
MVRQRHLDQVIFRRLILVDERRQRLHVFRHLDEFRRQVLRLRNAHRVLPIRPRRGVALALQLADGDGVQFADEMVAQAIAGLNALLDLSHRRLDVLHFPQLIGRRLAGASELAFHIIGQGGVVALDARRAQTFEHVKNVLELKEDRRRRRALKLQAAQMLQLGQHIHQRRIERRVEESQIVMNKGRHQALCGNG